MSLSIFPSLTRKEINFALRIAENIYENWKHFFSVFLVESQLVKGGFEFLNDLY